MTAPADQAWRSRARCATEGDPTWFDDRIDGESDATRIRRHKAARQVCALCPVKRECRTEARKRGEEGVWGRTLMPATSIGPPSPRNAVVLTDEQRRARRNERRRALKECRECGEWVQSRSLYSHRRTHHREAA